MNVDMLKMLNLSTSNKSEGSQNKITTSSEDQNSFLSILSDAISSDSTDLDTLSSIIEGTTNEENNQNNDLLTLLMLLMQQGISLQDNVVDYDNILSSLNNTENSSVNTLNNVMQNITSTNLSYENLEGLLLAQQNQNTQINNELVTNQVEATAATRTFPTEIMESINSLRQVRDNISSKLNLDNITNNSSTSVAFNNSNSLDTTTINNVVNTVNVSNNSDNMTNQIITDIIDNTKEIKIEGISEALLSANGVNIQNDNKIITVSDESSIIKDSVMTQIKDQIVLMKAEGKQTVTMQLTPENLGKLDIKMIFEGGNLSIEILTSNSKAQSIILSNISELKSILQNSFADRTFVNVEAQKQSFENNENQNNQGYSQQHSQEHSQDGREKEYEQLQSNILDDSGNIDFFEELSRIREYRYNSLSKI